MIEKTRMGLFDTILIINIVLKLCKVIDWSWWAVLWPLWVGIILFIVCDLIIQYICCSKKNTITIKDRKK